MWLIAFSGIYLLAARVAWRGNYTGLAIVSAIAIVLSVVTGFSIGDVYLPAALGLYIGALMFYSSKLLKFQ